MDFLRRYTNLAATIHLLRARKITLLNPATWDDKNDAYFMGEYKRLKDAETVLALCFTEVDEQYHHWRVFANGTAGACIKFKKSELLTAFKNDSKTKQGRVQYKLISSLVSRKIAVEELPFLKRRQYRDEREYRIIYADLIETIQSKDYDIQLDWIDRITLSPWMPKKLYRSVSDTIKSIDGCSKIITQRSTLVESEAWKSLTSRIRAIDH